LIEFAEWTGEKLVEPMWIIRNDPVASWALEPVMFESVASWLGDLFTNAEREHSLSEL